MSQPLPHNPDTDGLPRTALARGVGRYVGSTRPMFLSASVLPVLVGSAWGWRAAGGFDWLVFLIALAAVALIHAGANVANDVADDRSGTDRVNEHRIHPFTGGSRFIQDGILTAGEMTSWAAVLFAAGIALGLVLVLLKGPWVLVFGVVGVAIGLAYSLPPVALNARGLGEAAVAVAFGVLPVAGGFWLQAGHVTGACVLVSLAVSLWVMAILIINEIPDIAADETAGKRTLVVRLGPGASGWLYLAVQAAAFLTLVLAAFAGAIGWVGLLLPAALLALAAWTARTLNTSRDSLRRGIVATLVIHALGSVWLAALALAAA